MISFEQFSFHYRPQQELYRGLTLCLPPGKLYGLVGMNGVGKSTLMRAIAGAIFPKSGEVKVLGHRPKERQPSFLSRIYLLPEQIALPTLTAKRYGQLYSPFYPRFSQEIFDTLLEEFKAPQNVKLPTLSHGQQKKALLAFALACQVDLLMLDEPTNGLDFPAKAIFRKALLRYLTPEQTVIISTHQIPDLQQLIDTLLIVHDQQIEQLDLETVAARLAFTHAATPAANALFATPQPLQGGYAQIVPHAEELPPPMLSTEPDLALLFEGFLANPQAFRSVLSKTLNPA